MLMKQNAAKWVNTHLHKSLAKSAAVKGTVLLKNSNNVLPLKSSFKKIGVFGKDAVDARLGGYSGPGNGIVNILDGIKKRANHLTGSILCRRCRHNKRNIQTCFFI
jgi:beta-glucosidase